MEDSRLMRLIAQGKTEYVEEVARRYYDDVYRFLIFKTGDRELAGDLTQETFLRFIRYLDSYQERNLKGYLLTLAMNVCRDHWKKDTCRRSEESLEQLWEEGLQEEPRLCGENAQERTAGRIVLKEALMRLPDFQREAILLYYYYGFKSGEIGKMTGVSASTVKSRIRQGCAKLKGLLGQSVLQE